jgi:hypothetical protein
MATPSNGAEKNALGGGLVVLCLVALAVAIAFGLLWASERGVDPKEVTDVLQEQVEPVSERSVTLVELLMDYEVGTVEERSDQLLALSTGEFRDQYETLLSGGLGKALSKAETTARARIVDGPDVSFTSSTEADAVMRVIQTAKKKGALIPRRIFYVVRFHMQNVSPDDTPDWRAARLDILSQQST